MSTGRVPRLFSNIERGGGAVPVARAYIGANAYRGKTQIIIFLLARCVNLYFVENNVATRVNILT